MIPATAMSTSRMTRTMAVAGLNIHTMADHGSVKKNDEAPAERGPHLHEGEFRTVGRAGRLSVHTLDERALGMTLLPACVSIIGHPEWLLEQFIVQIPDPARMPSLR
jgi:hypothetical protein